jgi:hypothetical protein
MYIPGLWEVEIANGQEIETVIQHVLSAIPSIADHSHGTSHTVLQLTVVNKLPSRIHEDAPPITGKITFLLLSNLSSIDCQYMASSAPSSPSRLKHAASFSSTASSVAWYPWVDQLHSILQWLESRRASPPFHKSRLLLLLKEVLLRRQRASLMLLLHPSADQHAINILWCKLFAFLSKDLSPSIVNFSNPFLKASMEGGGTGPSHPPVSSTIKRSSSAHRIRGSEDSAGPSSLKRATSFQEEKRRAMTPPHSSSSSSSRNNRDSSHPLANSFDPVSCSVTTIKRANTLPSSSSSFSFPVSSSSQGKSGQRSSSVSRSNSYHEEEKQYAPATAAAADDQEEEEREQDNHDDNDEYGEDVRYVESTEEDDHPHSLQQHHHHHQQHGSSFLSAGGDLSPIPSFRNIPEPTANPINVRSDHHNAHSSHHHPSAPPRKTSFDSSVNTGGGGGGGGGPGTYIEDFNNHEVTLMASMVSFFFLSFFLQYRLKQH